MTNVPSIVPDDMPRQVRAFMHHIEKHLKPNSPSFALVVMAEDGAPYHLLHANRTGLVIAATGLLYEAIEQEKAGSCICPSCDARTAEAKLALKAMGHELEAVN